MASSSSRCPTRHSRPDGAFLDRLAGLEGGVLADAVRRDPVGAARRILERVAWVPDLAAVIDLQPSLPAGWAIVSRDGSAVAGPVAIALGRPAGTLDRAAELERLAAELRRLEADAADLDRVAAGARDAAATSRAAVESARTEEAGASAARRAADDLERAEGRAAEAAAREAGWATAQAERTAAEADRARAVVAGLEADAAGRASETGGPDPSSGTNADAATEPSALVTWEARATDLRARRDRIAADRAVAETARREAEAVVARAAAAATYDEERIGRAEADARALADREAGLLAERERLAVDVAAAGAREGAARAILDELRSADAVDRERLLAAEGLASAARERLRAAEERVRSAEVADLEARLGLDAIREQVLVELAGIGIVGLRALRAAAVDEPPALTGSDGTMPTPDDAAGAVPAGSADPEDGLADAAGDAETAELEAILPFVLPAWEAAAPPTEPPTPGRLATLRRRFHELGAANPFAVEEYAELRERLEALEAQGADLREAIDRTRDAHRRARRR